jgi:5-methyltetrahydrofolate--homocysteine methyltransferase
LKGKLLETIITRTEGKSRSIGSGLPLTIIGEKINPTGKKKFSEELLGGDLSRISEYAVSQADAGAHIIDINVGAAGIDEKEILPEAVKIVMKNVDIPLSIDSANPEAIQEALKVYTGKALVNSVTGEKRSLESVLPIVKKYKAAVIGLAFDERGPANDTRIRLEVARKILNRAQEFGIPKEDVLIDCVVRPVSLENNAALLTLETLRSIKKELGINTILGISNVSFGLPERKYLNAAFLAMAVARGLNCAITDPTVTEIKKTLLAADLLSGNDEFASNWIQHYRSKKSSQQK